MEILYYDRIALYARTSFETTDDGYSIEHDSITHQLEQMRNRINAFNVAIPAENIVEYVDRSRSGAKKENRSDFIRLLNDIEHGRIQVVIVFRFDRLSRRLSLADQITVLFEKHKIKFISLLPELALDYSNIDSPEFLKNSTYLNTIKQGAEMEWNAIITRIRSHKKSLRAKGYSMQRLPLGYKKRINSSGSQENFYELSDRATDVKEIFDMFTIKGMDLKDIRNIMVYERGIRSRVKGKEDAPQSTEYFKRILMNPIYAGLMKYDGGLIEITNMDQPIISTELYYETQEKLKNRKYTRLRKKQLSLGQGIIKCPKCGNNMYPKPEGNKDFYICKNKDKCKSKRYKSIIIDELLINKLFDEILYTYDFRKSLFSISESEFNDYVSGRNKFEVERINKSIDDEIILYTKKTDAIKDVLNFSLKHDIINRNHQLRINELNARLEDLKKEFTVTGSNLINFTSIEDVKLSLQAELLSHIDAINSGNAKRIIRTKKLIDYFIKSVKIISDEPVEIDIEYHDIDTKRIDYETLRILYLYLFNIKL